MASIKNNKKPFIQEPKINREIRYPMDKMVRAVYTEPRTVPKVKRLTR